MQNYKLKFKIFIIPIVILLFSLSLSYVFAATDYTKGLVPCGPDSDCTWNKLYELVGRIINFMVEIAFALVALMIVYGGFVVMTAGDNSSRVQEGWKIIQAAVIGLLITLLAWTIMSTLIQALCSGKSVSFKPWEAVKSCVSGSIQEVVAPTQ